MCGQPTRPAGSARLELSVAEAVVTADQGFLVRVLSRPAASRASATSEPMVPGSKIESHTVVTPSAVSPQGNTVLAWRRDNSCPCSSPKKTSSGCSCFDGKSIRRAPQSGGDPPVSGTYNSQYRAESDMELRDSLAFRIAAKIVDIRPNGNLVIEAHQDIENNEELWRISLTGVVRREAIQADRTVNSDSIAELKILKKELGQVRDGYARGWFTRWYDHFKPF